LLSAGVTTSSSNQSEQQKLQTSTSSVNLTGSTLNLPIEEHLILKTVGNDLVVNTTDDKNQEVCLSFFKVNAVCCKLQNRNLDLLKSNILYLGFF